jgi:hypothetical protein
MGSRIEADFTGTDMGMTEWGDTGRVLTPFRSRQSLKRTSGSALWSGTDDPRSGVGRSATWREAAVLSG